MFAGFKRNVLYALKDLLREMNYETAPTGAVKKVDSYFDQLQQILGASKEKWTKQVMPTNKTKA